jgi:hypothetical protein
MGQSAFDGIGAFLQLFSGNGETGSPNWPGLANIWGIMLISLEFFRLITIIIIIIIAQRQVYKQHRLRSVHPSPRVIIVYECTVKYTDSEYCPSEFTRLSFLHHAENRQVTKGLKSRRASPQC